MQSTTTVDRGEDARPRREPFSGHQALVLIGVARLGVLTDAMGPASAQTLLATLTARLQATIGPSGSLSRIGDDEFAVICDELRAKEQAVSLARRLVEAVTPLIVVDGLDLHLTAHAGVAYAVSAVGTSRLLDDASAALAQARLHPHQAVGVYELSQ